MTRPWILLAGVMTLTSCAICQKKAPPQIKATRNLPIAPCGDSLLFATLIIANQEQFRQDLILQISLAQQAAQKKQQIFPYDSIVKHLHCAHFKDFPTTCSKKEYDAVHKTLDVSTAKVYFADFLNNHYNCEIAPSYPKTSLLKLLENLSDVETAPVPAP